MAGFVVDKTLDCKGLSCPMPVVRTKKMIDSMQSGEVLEILATDPGSVADMQSWSSRVGHEFLATETDENVFKHYIRKA